MARAALAYLEPGGVVGVGTGSTAAFFIEELAARPELAAAAVPSSEATAAALRDAGIRVAGLDEAPAPAVYVDGADAVDPGLRLIKGAGGALVREKIVAKGIPDVRVLPTPDACREYNRLFHEGRKVALLAHGTC